MKILVVHYAYWITGGPERYLFNIKKGLENAGHTVVPFSMASRENFATQYAKYFIRPINFDGAWYYNANSFHFSTITRQISRLFFSIEVHRNLRRLIKDEKPDVAYILLFHKKLSPSVITRCHLHGLPIFMRLSDYLRICPRMTLYREGRICELCRKTKLYSIRHRCVKGSFIASLLWFVADKVHHIRNIYGKIDTFIATNPFMKEKMQTSGYSGRYTVLASPVEENTAYLKSYFHKKQQFCYVGNLFEHKGIDWLLEGFVKFNKRFPEYKLVIMGRDSEGILKQRLNVEPGMAEHIEYRGSSGKDEVLTLLAESRFSLITAKWYENLPNSVLESFSVGTPVIGTDLGSLRHMIRNQMTGYRFEYGNIEDLAEKMVKGICLTETEYECMQQRCLTQVAQTYNLQAHCKSLIHTFQQGLNRKKREKKQA